MKTVTIYILLHALYASVGRLMYCTSVSYIQWIGLGDQICLFDNMMIWSMTGLGLRPMNLRVVTSTRGVLYDLTLYPPVPHIFGFLFFISTLSTTF